jgi:hypothetical protein
MRPVVDDVDDRIEDTWAGHLPTTQRRLLAILQRAAAGAEDFTSQERALVLICEFRAAVVARDLDATWNSNTDENLRATTAVTGAIGLWSVAKALMDARRDLAGSLTPAFRRQRLKALELELLGLKVPVDQIIDQFAQGMPRQTRPQTT